MSVNLVHYNACAKCGERNEFNMYSVDLSKVLCDECDLEFFKWCESNPGKKFDEFLTN